MGEKDSSTTLIFCFIEQGEYVEKFLRNKSYDSKHLNQGSMY